MLNFNLAVAAFMLLCGSAIAQTPDSSNKSPTTTQASALAFTVKNASGDEIPLAEKYKGKVVLVVNVASKCGYTPQYEGLEKLHEKLAPKGFALLAFPCNQFANQEPGTISQILEFCESTYKVKFDVFDKVDVNGEKASPLFKYLTGPELPIADKGPVKWNFEKFLIGKDGKVIARYRSAITPEQIEKDIEAALAK